MHAGYDYLLSPGRLKRNKAFYLSISSCLVGIILVVCGCLYYLLAWFSTPISEKFSVAIQDPISNSRVYSNQSVQPTIKNLNKPDISAAPPKIPGSAIPEQSIGYGELSQLSTWPDSDSYEPISYRMTRLLEGFQPLDISQAQPVGSLKNPNRLIVPAIGINAPVHELRILDKGTTRKYESPNNIVGHIPESANPGEAGSSWFFAHMESPIIGEGSLFFNLPLISSLLSKGENIHIIAENDLEQHLYLVTSTEIIREADMKLYNAGWASIHLVTCVPRLAYDHRLIVTGELIGLKNKH